MNNLYTIHQLSKMFNVTTQTLRNWDKRGVLKPIMTANNGYRYYDQHQIDLLLNKNKIDQREIIGYCRVSSLKQKDDLERQISCVTTYMQSKGYQYRVIKDIGSGINYNKPGLNELISLITDNKVAKIIVLHKDRLLRFGYDLIFNIAKKYNTEIEIIDNTEVLENEELVKDMIQIITVFSARLNGKRSHVAAKIIKELKNNIGDASSGTEKEIQET